MDNKLYLVPTPVGNLEDLTFRALRILKEADLILAEDTRTTSKLLKHYAVQTQVVSYHNYNEHKKLQHYIDLLNEEKCLALVSDAGTPSISDPGFLLVRECIRNEIEVECLPGATAFVPALVNSGLPSDRFAFEGFLPHKKGRNRRLEDLSSETRTLIFYESPFRLVKTLNQLAEVFSLEHYVCVSRELSKMHEENRRGNLEEIIAHYMAHPPKGEIVIVFDPNLPKSAQ